MSIRYESFDARRSTLAYESTDDLYGYDAEDEPEMVLALSGDEAALIHGAPMDILRLLDSARESILAHLADQDGDEDGDLHFLVSVELDAEPVAGPVAAAQYARDFLLKYAPGLIYHVKDQEGRTFVVDLADDEPEAEDYTAALHS